MTDQKDGQFEAEVTYPRKAAGQIRCFPGDSRSMPSLIARWAATVSALLALLVTVIGVAVTPGHSHSANYISELGARGEAYGELVSLGGFLPIGITALVALVASLRLEGNRMLRASILWMLTLPLAYITAAFAWCAPGCAGLDAQQALHNLAGMGEYLGGTVALGVAGFALFRSGSRALGLAFWALAVVVFVCLYAIGSPLLATRGASQRVAEVVLFGFLLYIAWRVPCNENRASGTTRS